MNDNTGPVTSNQNESSWMSPLPYELLSGVIAFQESQEMGLNRRNRNDGQQISDTIPSGHTCDVCGRWFQNGVHLARHCLIHTGEKPFKCQHCAYESNQKSALNRHFRSVHLGIKKPIQELTEEEKLFYRLK